MAELWDYLIVSFYKSGGVTDMTVNGTVSRVSGMQAGLQTLGDEGWELVAVESFQNNFGNFWTTYFKRRRQ